MNNLAKLALLLSAACPMMMSGQSATKATTPPPKAQSAAKEQAPQTPSAKAPTAKEQSPQTPPPKPTELPTPLIRQTMEKIVDQVITMKYADPYEILQILDNFRTKSLEGTMLEAFETSSARGIIVRDTSSVCATITRAVAALDVPTAVSDDEPSEENQFDLRFDVIWASNSKNPVGDEIPPFLKDTASTIVKTLNYRFLAYGGTFMQTVSNNGRASGGGTIPRPHKDIQFGTYGQNFTWELKTSSKYSDYISGLFSAKYAGGQISNAKIELKPGQKVVIGTTMVGEGIAMIVVISVS